MRRAWWILGGLVGIALTLGARLLSPVKGRITSRFREAGRPDHNGTDIAAPNGTPIVAPGPGVVSFANYTERGGKQLGVLLDNGYTVGFAHLSTRAAAVGARVNKGQEIARSGSTGIVTGPHVHVSLRDRSGEFIDPETFFTFS